MLNLKVKRSINERLNLKVSRSLNWNDEELEKEVTWLREELMNSNELNISVLNRKSGFHVLVL